MHIFRRWVPHQLRLQQIVRLASRAGTQSCLFAGSNPAIAYWLTKRGGWRAWTPDAERLRRHHELLCDAVGVDTGFPLPYADKSFETVALSGVLEHAPDVGAVIAECHRVLKPSGRLIVDVPHAKRWPLLGRTRRGAGPPARAFTEQDLFQSLKEGFDVLEAHTFQRFFVSAVERAADRAAQLEGPQASGRAGIAIARRAYPLFLAALQLDALLFFTRGYRLAALARRHLWRPRNVPVLSDGRSISEAVLETLRH